MNLTYDCSHVVDIADEPRHHLVIANEFVRAFAVEIPAHDRTLCHRHPQDYLLYVACGTEIVSAARGEEPKRLSYSDGECELSEAGLVHVVENLGDTPFRNVVVELSPRTGELRRGAEPSVMIGHAEAKRILDTEPGAVFSVKIEPGGEVEILGPAVLAVPRDDGIMAKEIEDFAIPLDDFRKLMWVCAPRKIWVRNSGQVAAQMIVFQVGHAGPR